jgi:hypothetical protein
LFSDSLLFTRLFAEEQSMNTETTEISIVTDSMGRIDVAYYVREAERLRSQFIRTRAAALFSKLRRTLVNLIVVPVSTRNA